MMEERRQSGRTTQQMLAAPEGAIYVWTNSRVTYPTDLSHHLKRSDLRIVPASWLAFTGNVEGGTEKVVLDHAMHTSKLREPQLYVLDYLEAKKRLA